jgi:hypothetical protein
MVELRRIEFEKSCHDVPHMVLMSDGSLGQPGICSSATSAKRFAQLRQFQLYLLCVDSLKTEGVIADLPPKLIGRPIYSRW